MDGSSGGSTIKVFGFAVGAGYCGRSSSSSRGGGGFASHGDLTLRVSGTTAVDAGVACGG